MNGVVLILRWVLAAVFVAAGVLKAWDPTGFAKDLGHYRLVSESIAAAVALYLPWLEIVLGLALLSRHWRRSATSVLLAFMAVFTVAMLSAWWRGIDLRCGCFGDRLTMPLAWSLARNTALTIGLGAVLLHHARSVAVDRASPEP